MKTNTCIKKETNLRKTIFLIAIILCFLFKNGVAQTTNIFAETAKLLSLLDLSKPGLEKVKQSANNPKQALTELLKYFRARTSVKHFINAAIESGEMEIEVFENGEQKIIGYKIN